MIRFEGSLEEFQLVVEASSAPVAVFPAEPLTDLLCCVVGKLYIKKVQCSEYVLRASETVGSVLYVIVFSSADRAHGRDLYISIYIYIYCRFKNRRYSACDSAPNAIYFPNLRTLTNVSVPSAPRNYRNGVLTHGDTSYDSLLPPNAPGPPRVCGRSGLDSRTNSRYGYATEAKSR